MLLHAAQFGWQSYNVCCQLCNTVQYIVVLNDIDSLTRPTNQGQVQQQKAMFLSPCVAHLEDIATSHLIYSHFSVTLASATHSGSFVSSIDALDAG